MGKKQISSHSNSILFLIINLIKQSLKSPKHHQTSESIVYSLPKSTIKQEQNSASQHNYIDRFKQKKHSETTNLISLKVHSISNHKQIKQVSNRQNIFGRLVT